MEDVFAIFDITPFDGVMILFGALFFVAIWKSLQIVLFDPYVKLVEERERATSGAQDHAAKEIGEANELNQQYERLVIEGRIAALEVKIKELDRAKLEAAEVIRQAENTASVYLEKERRTTDKDLEELRREVMSQSSAMVSMILEKVKAPGGVTGNA